MALTKIPWVFLHSHACARSHWQSSVSEDAMSALQLANRNSDCWPIPVKLARFQRIRWRRLCCWFSRRCARVRAKQSLDGRCVQWYVIYCCASDLIHMPCPNHNSLLRLWYVTVIIKMWLLLVEFGERRINYSWTRSCWCASVGDGVVLCSLLPVRSFFLPMLATLRTMPMLMAYSCMLACRSAINKRLKMRSASACDKTFNDQTKKKENWTEIRGEGVAHGLNVGPEYGQFRRIFHDPLG